MIYQICLDEHCENSNLKAVEFYVQFYMYTNCGVMSFDNIIMTARKIIPAVGFKKFVSISDCIDSLKVTQLFRNKFK